MNLLGTWRRYKLLMGIVISVEFLLAFWSYLSFGIGPGMLPAIVFGVLLIGLNLYSRKSIKEGFEEEQGESGAKECQNP